MKDVIISIKSIRRFDGNDDCTELITAGGYCLTKDGCELSYTETEATGYDGSVTSVSVATGKSLEIVRSGKFSSELLIDTHRKNYSCYGTPYGDLTVGATAKKIEAKLDETGGSIIAEYSMDINSQDMGDYSMEIVVRPAK